MNFAARALARDPLYVGLGIVTLAIGLAAAILAALYVRDELSYDRFIPGHDRIAVVITHLAAPGRSKMTMDYSPGGLAAMLKTEVPGLAQVTRLAFDDVSVGHGDFQAREQAAWVDPNFFDVVRLPGLAGDARQAARFPDGAVITRTLARKYFGSSRALGSTIRVDGSHDVQVRAVIEDLPADSHLAPFGLFLSGRSAASVLSRASGAGFFNAVVDPKPFSHVRFIRERTYVRLAEGFGEKGLGPAMAKFSRAHARKMAPQPTAAVRFSLIPLDRLHTYPFRGANLAPSDVHIDLASLVGLGALGGLILLLAVTNFVNLATARSAGRAREVGVRKAVGGSQAELVRQFLGETLVQVVIATILASSIVELSLPFLNSFLMTGLRFDYWREPAVAVSLLASIVVVTLLSGAYPALVLACLRPAQALRDGIAGGGSAAVRNGLVSFQFSVLVVLLLGAAVIGLQTRYAMTAGLRLDTDGVLVVQTPPPCQGVFADEVRRLPGVRSAGCASKGMLGVEDAYPIVTDARLFVSGRSAAVALGLADFGTFETLGVRPLAGRLFQLDHREIDQLPDFDRGAARASTVLNESAVRALGFARAADIVGRTLRVPRSGPNAGADAWTVIGVVPDFTLDVRSAAVKPTAYIVKPDFPFEQVLAIRLEGRRIPETLGAIDRLWNTTGHLGAPRRQFLSDYVQRLYLVTTRQGALVFGLCLIATVLACAGLLALASYSARRRTKEIGVRKAMGACAGDIVRMLLLQFSRPIGLGILVGTPIAYAAAGHWLAGFTYHIELRPWLFGATGLIALCIGLGAGLFHALAVARARPVDALRYE